MDGEIASGILALCAALLVYLLGPHATPSPSSRFSSEINGLSSIGSRTLGKYVEIQLLRMENPLECINPIRISGMVEDDAYFRAKNFGRAGVGGAFRNSFGEAALRLKLSALRFFLAFVHLTSGIPGAIRGLVKKDRQLGTLETR
jgi:hypothetical protein